MLKGCTRLGRRSDLWLALIAVLLIASACSKQSEYPSKAVKLIVPFGPGGPSDVNARLIAEHGKSEFPKGIVVEDVPGGSATVGSYQAISAPPDGYTWLYGGTAELASALHRIKAPYSMDDYQLILKIGNMPTVLLVKKDPRWSTLKDFVEYARSNPGTIKVGTPGDASVNRLVGEIFAEAAGIRLVMVPFSGNSAVIPGLLGGHIQAGLVNAPDAKAHAKPDSDIQALAVFATQRVSGVSEIPTAKEQGFDTVGTVSHYIAVPKQTPASVAESIRTRLQKVLAKPEYVKAEEAIAFQVEYKDAAAARDELKDWYDTAGRLYEKLGMK
jgi:putative tricarboxylic transport membrane protein